MRKGLIISLGLLLGIQWWQPVQAASALQVAGVLFDRTPSALTIQQSVVNDPLYSQQTYLNQINIPPAWSVSSGNSSPIAVIDTGIDLHHEDLVGKLWVNSDETPGNGLDDDHNGYVDDYNGYNFVSDNADISDTHGHGTGIASIIAARTNNSLGMAGINWSAPLMVLKALNSVGGGDFPTVSAALRYAVNNGARIVNMSFGAYDNTTEMTDAVNFAVSRNVVIIAAVGNGHAGSIYYPAAYPSVIAVSSLSSSNQLSSFSNYGPGTDVAAPGENIIMAGSSANNVSSYVQGSGSSFAAAEVTGVASLLIARYPNLTSTQVDEVLKNTADKLSSDPAGQYFGAGRVNASAALNYQPRTLTANLTLSPSSAAADGLSFLTVSAKVTDEFGQPQTNLPVDLTLSGSANIVNGALLSESTPLHLGTTDRAGIISFSVGSTYAETKRITFTSGAATITSNVSSLTFRPVYRPRYTMQWLQQSPTVNLAAGSSASLWLDVKNTGNVAWVSDRKSTSNRGNLRLGTDRSLDRNSNYYDPNSWPSRNRSSYMTPEIVRPGETAHFNFTILSSQGGSGREYFRPVIDYVTWLNDLGIYWEIKGDGSPSIIQPADSYSASLLSKSADITLAPGQTTSFWVELTNTGSVTWTPAGSDSRGTGSVRLGTTSDRASLIYSSSWLSSNRIANVGLSVPPGATLKLLFTITAPATPGVYTENFRLVSEYVTWFGPVFGWTLTVK